MYALPISKGACKGAESHGRSESTDEQSSNLAPIKAIVLVQCIDVRALQPVASCMDTCALSTTTFKQLAAACACDRAHPS